MSSFSYAHDDDVRINNATELKAWCKQESQNYFAAIEKVPYNWTASWWTEGNTIFAEGVWRVNGDDIVVKCRIVRGAERKYAVYELVNKTDLK